MPKGVRDAMESSHWNQQDLWTQEERSPCWSRFAGRTCDPVGDPHWSRLLLKDCSQWKRPMLKKFMENRLPWEGLYTGAGEECEEEGAAETTCDELTTTPFPVSLHHRGGGEVFLRCGFISHYPTLILLVIN